MSDGAAAHDLVGFILDVAVDPAQGVSGFWTARIPGTVPGATYAWQAEVLIAPGFSFEVERIDRLGSATPPGVVRVIGKQV